MLAKIEVPLPGDRHWPVATIGASRARKFDCEAWVPTQQAYRKKKLTSTSNCTHVPAAG